MIVYGIEIIDRAYVRGVGTTPQYPAKFIESGLVAARGNFYASVRIISNPARQPKATALHSRKPAKSNSLHAPANAHMHGRHRPTPAS